MLNLTNVLVLNKQQNAIIKRFGVLTADHWKRNQTRLRKAIWGDLQNMQKDRCVYCGCRVWGNGDVEHIAHKSAYPQFLFTPKNLAYSCKRCNQKFKGDTNVVSVIDTAYDKCQFTIVHPYMDDVSHFFDTTKLRIQIQPNLNTADAKKAQTTYSLFHWDDPDVVEQRAANTMVEEYALENNTSVAQVAADNALTYRPRDI